MREFFKQFIGKENLYGVEIGVQKGENASEVISRLNKEIRFFVLVDPWKAYSPNIATEEEMLLHFCEQEAMDYWKFQAYNRLCGYGQVLILPFDSVEAFNLLKSKLFRFDFVYVDSSHRPVETLDTLWAWYKLLRNDGVIGGHDYAHATFGKGIQKAVREFANELQKPIQVGGEDWWIQL